MEDQKYDETALVEEDGLTIVEGEPDSEGNGDGEKEEEEKPKALGKPAETSVVPTDALQRYLAEVRRYPLLTREEEYDLAVQYKKFEDPQAAFRMVTSNLRLVIKIAMDFRKGVINLLDLIQEGNIGLMRAVKDFDPYRGVRLSSYASYWIKAYIIRFILNNWRLVKIGTTQAQRKLFFRLNKERERLEATGYDPTPKLIAQNLDVTEAEVVEMSQRLGHAEVSLFTQLADKSSRRLIDIIKPDVELQDEAVVRKELHEILEKSLEPFLAELSDRDRVIFTDRVLSDEPRTLQEIGDEFGITRERVRQIEERMLKAFKKKLKKDLKD